MRDRRKIWTAVETLESFKRAEACRGIQFKEADASGLVILELTKLRDVEGKNSKCREEQEA